ncbi:MAG: hypothetical protein NTY30_02555 [Candidatus Berkelbacteria bacterium]|nr:hypothetical protein [Candidatus Berkelbacteria bacterium]
MNNHEWVDGKCSSCGTTQPPDEFINPNAICLGSDDEIAVNLADLVQQNGGILRLYRTNTSLWPSNESQQLPIRAMFEGPVDIRQLTNDNSSFGIQRQAFEITGAKAVAFSLSSSPTMPSVIVWGDEEIFVVSGSSYYGISRFLRNPQATEGHPILATIS